MNTQTTIVLSKEALDALFPEGSEARIQFATSAVKAFCEREIKPAMISADVARMIEQQRRVAVDQVVKNLGGIETHRGIAFTDGFKDRLRAAAEAEVVELLKSTARVAVADQMPQLMVRIKEQMRLEANKAVREAINAAVSAALPVAQ